MYCFGHCGILLPVVLLPAPLIPCLQAITLAPLFVWFEFLFLLGYRPQLYAQLQQRVTADIAKFKKKAH